MLLVFQPLGTPTNTAIHQYMNAKKVPQLFVATGATKWGQPDKFPWTMGWQPNYQSEARIYARYILDNQPDAKIGVLYQNDDYGKDYLEGFKAGLGDKADRMIVEELSYEVTDPDGRFADHLAQEQRARTYSSTSPRPSSPPRRSARPPTSAGSRCTCSTTSRTRWARC